MLFRQDNKQLPVGCVPIGSGDDFCGNLGMNKGEIQKSIQYIASGQTIKTDCIQIILDHDSEAALENAKVNKLDHMRYSIVNSGFSLTATVARTAIPYK